MSGGVDPERRVGRCDRRAPKNAGADGDEAERMRSALQRHIDKLREANAQLVIAALKAQVVTEEVQRAKDALGHLAHHDFLTGLPNRPLLMERMAQAIGMAQRQHSRMAVLFIDLDRFKIINDSLGHAVGDLLLQAVGQRLVAAIRASDTASRLGGDEFVVLLAEVANERSASELADKLCRALAEPFDLDGQTAHIGGTIGISMYPDDGEQAEALIRNADVAMYHGKHSGRNRCYFFRPEMNLRALERQRVEADLHRALARGDFELYYQPRVNLASGAIAGAEALLRWTHPEHGAVAPSRFIPVAEECGLIVPIGHWVLREACMQVARWKADGLDPGVIAVNISALEFRDDGFTGRLRAALADSGLSPQCLELEITEGVLMDDAGASAAILAELKEIGVLLAIDDFGTGYSSLSYLNRFPIDVLKIDQSFVHGISAAPGDGVIVGAVIAMGGSLGHKVVAEGVERQSQLDFLRERHCDEGQGYLFSLPLAADAFAALLARRAGP
ncbi:diguanylate cyclase (GGDEF)-like protein [Duganella sp. 1411]|jgi:diguanylate cyclase (GGDEF)-like protein|uniref:putative bifunctional diguanylate cyclase/phosphodiesterase n=1 Tax=Duganella sp. 1411 TaxID=2806572 RepID=UPI001AE62EC4|nr:EAL domain-containing protein [Duganella sp. 1411]MBP1202870.1 diguanylate cyclase (GGDEF)-like protein [Duganella sp. 1411]